MYIILLILTANQMKTHNLFSVWILNVDIVNEAIAIKEKKVIYYENERWVIFTNLLPMKTKCIISYKTKKFIRIYLQSRKLE